MKIVPVILAGGTGKRLWPISRAAQPKQFIKLLSDHSLFQQTLLRLTTSELYEPPVVITNYDYRFLVADQAIECGVTLNSILLEPCARGTAAAITATSSYLNNLPSGRIINILPSDHFVLADDRYFDAIELAYSAAEAGRLVTFGIQPTEPATGYGYIEAAGDKTSCILSIQKFHEKPDLQTAKKLITKEGCYWNSGIFLFNSSVFLNECERQAADVYAAAIRSVSDAKADVDFVRLDEKAFANSPSISVDYAIFEKTNLASVVPSSFEWSDLGAWDAVWKMGEADQDRNVAIGSTTLNNTKRSLVFSDKIHVAVDGLDDIAVIVSEDAAYVGQLSNAQNVSQIVAQLERNVKTSHLTESHLTNYRPWGGYSSILIGARFQVKRLFVKPGKRLSLQKHHHRSEHWIVVSGTADVEVGETKKILMENQSTYIPQGAVHRLSNSGKILLELIEIQIGSYLAEDDIVRIEDEFGRV